MKIKSDFGPSMKVVEDYPSKLIKLMTVLICIWAYLDNYFVQKRLTWSLTWLHFEYKDLWGKDYCNNVKSFEIMENG